MGVPWSDAGTVGSLLGIRAVTNEILAYEDLGKLARGPFPAAVRRVRARVSEGSSPKRSRYAAEKRPWWGRLTATATSATDTAAAGSLSSSWARSSRTQRRKAWGVVPAVAHVRWIARIVHQPRRAISASDRPLNAC